MMLERGEKVHVITRRGFEEDVRRHFAGEVRDCSDSTARVEGYVFVHDPSRNEFVRRRQRRTRLVSLIDADNVINVLPSSVDLDALVYRISPDNRLVITDDRSFQMDINEFGGKR